jgi:hypothetical protein
MPALMTLFVFASGIVCIDEIHQSVPILCANTLGTHAAQHSTDTKLAEQWRKSI